MLLVEPWVSDNLHTECVIISHSLVVIYASNLSGLASAHILELSHQVGILDNANEYKTLSSVRLNRALKRFSH
jgi:hypothetical protein